MKWRNLAMAGTAAVLTATGAGIWWHVASGSSTPRPTATATAKPQSPFCANADRLAGDIKAGPSGSSAFVIDYANLGTSADHVDATTLSLYNQMVRDGRAHHEKDWQYDLATLLTNCQRDA